MICRFVNLPIWRFADLSIFVETSPLFYITSPQPPSKGEPIHEHYTNNHGDYTSNYEDYTLTH